MLHVDTLLELLTLDAEKAEFVVTSFLLIGLVAAVGSIASVLGGAAVSRDGFVEVADNHQDYEHRYDASRYSVSLGSEAKKPYDTGHGPAKCFDIECLQDIYGVVGDGLDSVCVDSSVLGEENDIAGTFTELLIQSVCEDYD